MLPNSPSASNQQQPSAPASERLRIQVRHPWQRPPTEQILGALQLLRRNNDVSRRQAFLLLDQGVETLFKTYLSLPASVTHTAMPESERIRATQGKFSELLQGVAVAAKGRVAAEDFDAVWYYHRLRNKLQHEDPGITVAVSQADGFAKFAVRLLRDLLGVDLDLQLTAAMEKNLLAPPAVSALVAGPKPYNNLPQPTYVRFVGRETELEWLRERLSHADRAWQIAINGIGGVGKTALALAVADEYRRRYHDLPPEERFEAIIWVSAKEEVLTAQGRERADLPDAILYRLEDVYTAIARVLKREEITRALPEEQADQVQKALQRQRTLLVIDNMESVQDDRVRAFLRKLPAPTKAIITSREWSDVADVKVLKGLSPEDAEKLIQEETIVRGVTLDTKQRERLYGLTAGLPLPIKLGIARVSAGESFEAVTRWLGDAVGDLPEYCIKGQVDLARQRDPNTWIVLLACALFDRETGASREALMEIADLSRADCEVALVHLQKLFLVSNTQDTRLGVLPLVQRYASAEFRMRDASQMLIDRWLKWLANFAQTYAVDDELEPEVMLIVGSEYSNLRAAIGWCYEHQIWDRMVEICEGTWPFAQRARLLYDLQEILDGWLRAAQATINHESEARVLTQMGWLYWTRGQIENAVAHLDRAEGLLGSRTHGVTLATAMELRSQILTNLKNFNEAHVLALQVLDLGKQMESPIVQFRGAYRLAAIESYRGNYDVAAYWLDHAEHLAIKLSSISRLTAVKYRRGANLVLEGRFVEAEPFVEQVLEVNIKLGESRYIAGDKHRLAEIYANTGRLQQAFEAAEEARELYDRLGTQIRLHELDDLLDQLSRQMQPASQRSFEKPSEVFLEAVSDTS